MLNQIHHRLKPIAGGLSKHIDATYDFNQNLQSNGFFPPCYDCLVPTANPASIPDKLSKISTDTVRVDGVLYRVQVSPDASTLTAIGNADIVVSMYVCEYDSPTSGALNTFFGNVANKCPFLSTRAESIYTYKDSTCPIDAPLSVLAKQNCRILYYTTKIINKENRSAYFEHYEQKKHEFNTPPGLVAGANTSMGLMVGKIQVLHVVVSKFRALPNTFGVYNLKYTQERFVADIGTPLV